MASLNKIPAFNKMRKTLYEASYYHDSSTPELETFISSARGRRFTLLVQQITDSVTTDGVTDPEFATLLNNMFISADQIDDKLNDPIESQEFRTAEIVDWLGMITAAQQSPIYQNTLQTQFDLLDEASDETEAEAIRQRLKTYIQIFTVNLDLLLYLCYLQQDPLTDEVALTEPLAYFANSLPESVRARPEMRTFFSRMALHLGHYDHQPWISSLVYKMFPGLIYEVMPARAAESYKANQTLAKPSFTFQSGSAYSTYLSALPLGVGLNSKTGEVYVTDPEQLVVGYHGGIQIRLNTDDGQTATGAFDLEFLPDLAAAYVYTSTMSLHLIGRGHLLAYINDPDGAIEYARVIEGTVPRGVKFNTSNGQFTVHDPDRLSVGSTDLMVEVIDVKGGKSIIEATITLTYIVPDEDYFNYTNTRPKPLSERENGDALLVANLPAGRTVESVDMLYGSVLPSGVSLNPTNATIYVSNASILTENLDWYTVQVTFTDGGILTYGGTPLLLPDIAFTYVMEPPQSLADYSDEDLLATPPTPSGPPYVSFFIFTIFGGSAPTGTHFDTGTGLLTVENSAGTMVPETSTLYFVQANDGFTDTIFFLDLIVWPNSNINYTPLSLTPEVDYLIEGSKLINVTHSYSPCASASLTTGELPPGSSLNAITGEITVTDPSEITDGTWTFSIMTVDTFGFEEIHSDVEIVILPND